MAQSYREHILTGRTVGGRYRLNEPTRAPLGAAGSVLGRSSGASLEFLDHRDYQPGDDLRLIDWSAYARSDRLVLKLYRQEFTPHLDILLDASASMALAGSSKAGGTMHMAAALATAAANGGYSYCCHVVGTDQPFAPNVDVVSWPDMAFSGACDVAMWLVHGRANLRPRSLRVFISDLLYAQEPLSILQPMAAGAAGLFVVQMLAQADVQPEAGGNAHLVDSETGDVRAVYLDAPAIKKYSRVLAAHQQDWRRSCRQVGAAMTTLTAEDVCSADDLTPLAEMGLLKPA